jgi:hypothetical protein
MKYYIYISKAKIDMLLPQVPEAFKAKFAAEIGIHLGLLNAKVSSELPRDLDDNIRRLEVVSNHIESSQEPGDLGNPKEWIKDVMSVKHLSVKENRELFLLVGKKYDQYHLLGGSSHHVVGNVRPADATIGYSYFPYLAGALTNVFSEWYSKINEARVNLDVTGDNLMRSIRQSEWSDVVYALYEKSDATTFDVEFLARFLSHGVGCTVSSPLYVRQM